MVTDHHYMFDISKANMTISLPVVLVGLVSGFLRGRTDSAFFIVTVVSNRVEVTFGRWRRWQSMCIEENRFVFLYDGAIKN